MEGVVSCEIQSNLGDSRPLLTLFFKNSLEASLILSWDLLNPCCTMELVSAWLFYSLGMILGLKGEKLYLFSIVRVAEVGRYLGSSTSSNRALLVFFGFLTSNVGIPAQFQEKLLISFAYFQSNLPIQPINRKL